MAKSKKVNKWEAAPESIRKLKELIDKQRLSISLGECEDLIGLDALEKVLKEYNELEAKHNADCGLISKLEETVADYKDTTKELEETVADREAQIDNLYKQIESLKDENKKIVEAADYVRDKHENEVCMLKKDIHDLEVKVKYYKEDIEDLECKVSKYKALYEGLESTLQKDLDAAKLDLKKEGEHSQALSKVITRKNTEMCNLKWQRDETEKKIKILTEELMKQYNIHVTFYQKPGIDMHGFRNFGVHVDCEENRKAFNELKETLDKHKSQINKLEEKHAKATRYISRLTKALNEAGVDFHYVKIGDDGEEIFHIDCLIDKIAKKHYEEQFSRLRDTIKNYEEHINSLCKDIDASNNRTGELFLALDRAGIHPIFDIRANKWRIQYTGKAENAFLAADQIKRDAEKKIDKLVSALDKCHLDAKWDHKNDKWCIRIRPSDTELTSVSVDLCEVIEGYEKLKNENNNLKQTLLNILRTLETKVGLCRIHLLDSYEDRANLIAVEHDKLLIKYEKLKEENKILILEKGDLKSKNRCWQVSYNAVQKKVEELTAERDGLNDYAEALKGRIQELEDRSKDIYNLATIGWLNNSMYGYEEIRKTLSFKPSTCTNCKNFDPKE